MRSAGDGKPTGRGPRRTLPRIVTPIPGPRSLALFQEERKVLAPGIQRLSQLARIAVREARGSVVTDADGNKLIDFIAGVAVSSLGHSHPAWVRAIRRQAGAVSVGSFTSSPRVELLKLLAEIAPSGLRRTQLYSGGAEAVEAGIRLAKCHTKNFEIVGFWGGFHGKTGGVLPLIGDEFKQGWGPLPAGNHLVPYPDCYRCPFKMTYPACGMYCMEFARRQLKVTTAGSIAALIVEPVQGTAGNVVPPAEFLPIVRDIAHENHALFVVDEMITGFGRTGTMFASARADARPDILLLGKGFGSGFPVTGLMARDEILGATPFSKPSAASSSYGGNPLACAAALAAVRTIQGERLDQNARVVGDYMLGRLREMKEKFPFIGDVRGQGLLLGMDLVRDRRSREPLPPPAMHRIYRECVRRGLLCMIYSPRVRLHPPLTITRRLAAWGLDVLEEVFGLVGTKIRIN